MNVMVCCNKNGAIQPFDAGTVFYSYDIVGFGDMELDHEEFVPAEPCGKEEKFALLKEHDCGILLCGRLSEEDERALSKLFVSPLAGCIGPADMAIKAFARGEKPLGLSCGGDCGSCAGDCESN